MPDAGREWGIVNKICGVCRKGISASACRQACFRHFNSMGLLCFYLLVCVFAVSRETEERSDLKKLSPGRRASEGNDLISFLSRSLCARS
jgi:hypothetical protein